MLSRILFLSSIGIIGTLAVPVQTAAMEMPSQNICSTCGQEKPSYNLLNLSYFSVRGDRCKDCKALKENKDIETGIVKQKELPTIIHQTVHYPDQQEYDEPDLEAGIQNTPQPKSHNVINVAKELCIVCAQPVDDGIKQHIYQCNHAIHKKCFSKNSETLQSCLICSQRKTEASAENKSGFFSWVFSSKPTAPKTEAPQEIVTMLKESYEQLAQRFNELQCHAQLLAQREQELLNQINAAEKKFATKQEMQDAANGLVAYKNTTRKVLNDHELSMTNLAKQQISDRKTINGLMNQLQSQNESAWIERFSLALGGLAALIAHNRKHSANVSTLIGFGTTATAYTLAQLSRNKK